MQMNMFAGKFASALSSSLPALSLNQGDKPLGLLDANEKQAVLLNLRAYMFVLGCVAIIARTIRTNQHHHLSVPRYIESPLALHVWFSREQQSLTEPMSV